MLSKLYSDSSSTDFILFILSSIMEADFSWMYLIIFLMIPLARILPRILKKLKSGNSESQEIPQRQFESNF